MNDKCAAGTGRFIYVMSRILEIDINDMGNMDALSENPTTVSSTCTVFAESEVISQLSKGIKKEDIIRGVHNSVVSKAAGLAYRTYMEDEIAVTGGVALNQGIVDSFEREFGKPVLIAEHPQLSAAIGAAIFAYEEVN